MPGITAEEIMKMFEKAIEKEELERREKAEKELNDISKLIEKSIMVFGKELAMEA